MTSRRSLSAGAVVMLAGVTVLLTYLYLRDIALVVVGYVCWRFLMHRAGFKRRPKSSWSSLIRSLSIAFAAWNTRWFRPQEKTARITKITDGEPQPLYDPFTGKELATTDDIPY